MYLSVVFITKRYVVRTVVAVVQGSKPVAPATHHDVLIG